MRALLKAGAKANITNNFGSSPLAEAVKLGDVELVRMLLDAHADANAANQDGETALMLASHVGSLPIAQLLVAHGANVNAVENFRGQTALMWATAENYPDIVDLLLAHGADVKRRAKSDDWPRQMTSEPRAQFRQTGGLTALLYATRSGCDRCAIALVQAGADVNQPNPDGITPLINALDNRSFDMAMFLLDKGANPNVWDMNGRTPLYVAVDMSSYRGRTLRAGDATGFAGYPGATAAHPRSKISANDVVNRLISLGVDTNHELTRMRPNGNGRGRFEDYMMRGGTGPLMIATLSYDDTSIKTLLAHGADVDAPNVFQITPLMAAAGMSGSGRGGGGGGGGGPRDGDVQNRVITTLDILLGAGATSMPASPTATPIPRNSPRTCRAGTTRASPPSSRRPKPVGIRWSSTWWSAARTRLSAMRRARVRSIMHVPRRRQARAVRRRAAPLLPAAPRRSPSSNRWSQSRASRRRPRCPPQRRRRPDRV